MAAVDHLAIYRSFTVAELTTEVATLRAKYRSEFTSQSGGGVSASRDIQYVGAKLEAATKALREKTNGRQSYTLGTFN